MSATHTRSRCHLELLVLALAIGCSRQSGRKSDSLAASASASAPASAPATIVLDTAGPHAPSGVASTTLLRLPISAYASTLAVDEAAVYLLTNKAAHRLVPGHEPQTLSLDLGVGPALTESSYIYWSKAAIWRTPKRGGRPSKVATVPHQPQQFVTSGEHFAWLDRTSVGAFTIQTLEGTRPRTVWSPAGTIDAIAMLHDWIFFVERAADSSWRFGGIRQAGGEPSFSPSRPGRTPAMLRVSDDIYYYDGNTIEIRRLSPDFMREETLAKQLICSPFAAAVRIYCAHMVGLFEVSKKPGAPPVLIQKVQGITAIAANATLVAWTRDVGPDQLAVEMLPLITGNGGPRAP